MDLVAQSNNRTPKNFFRVIGNVIWRNRLEAIKILLLILFVYTGVSKIIEHEKMLRELQSSPELGFAAKELTFLIPAAEIVTCVLLFFPRTLHLGMWASFLLMLSFTIYVAYMLLYAVELPCSCGGIISLLSWKQHLFVNIVFTLLAAWGIMMTRKKKTNGI